MTDPEFYTATLARLYAKQGHLRKAAEIYRHLLQREPGRSELAVELAEVEDTLSLKGADAALLPMFSRWVRMLLHYRRLKKLESMKKRFSDG